MQVETIPQLILIGVAAYHHIGRLLKMNLISGYCGTFLSNRPQQVPPNDLRKWSGPTKDDCASKQRIRDSFRAPINQTLLSTCSHPCLARTMMETRGEQAEHPSDPISKRIDYRKPARSSFLLFLSNNVSTKRNVNPLHGQGLELHQLIHYVGRMIGITARTTWSANAGSMLPGGQLRQESIGCVPQQAL